jgi:hypothetical protein
MGQTIIFPEAINGKYQNLQYLPKFTRRWREVGTQVNLVLELTAFS